METHALPFDYKFPSRTEVTGDSFLKLFVQAPFHTHQCRQWLRQVDIEEVEVEIWPSSTVWQKGETLRVVVQGQPFFDQDNRVASRFANAHSFGEARVWFGGKYDSQLYLPVVR
ncbi:hypothetical protein BJY01DRAFT_252320 [Aspergillus pseudoustus]|uniref:Xaa-Pro dipeptidyl-peptidase C-terminal domain-containing protein n=1 Tax=Aspergillus pseudoustus TaxID=1810923 RepID=A0ABR4J738_9EURO